MGYCEKCDQDCQEVVEVKRDTPMGSWVETYCEPCVDAMNDAYIEQACRDRHSA